jgi:SpoVK/Ycf46/Vps4 family AAA+-type ATPase
MREAPEEIRSLGDSRNAELCALLRIANALDMIKSRARVYVMVIVNDISRLPPELLGRGRFDELFFVDLPTSEERKEIISIYIKRDLKKDISSELMEELVNLSDGFAGSDIESAVREVVIHAILKGDETVQEEIFRKSFSNVAKNY